MDTKSIVFLIIAMLVLVTWYPLMHELGWLSEEQPQGQKKEIATQSKKKPEPAREKNGETQKGEEETEPDSEQADRAERSEAEELRQEENFSESGGGAMEETRLAGSGSALNEKKASIRSPEALKMKINQESGGAGESELLDYLTSDRDKNIVLGKNAYPAYKFLMNGKKTEGNIKTRVLEHGEHSFELQRHVERENLIVRQTWRLKPEKSYQVDYEVTVLNDSDKTVDLSDMAVSIGAMRENIGVGHSAMGGIGIAGLEVDLATRENDYPNTYSAKNVKQMEESKQKKLMQQKLDWVGVHNKYFILFLQYQGENNAFRGCRLKTIEESVPSGKNSDGEQTGTQKWLLCEVLLPQRTIAPGEKASFSLDGYAGPKELERIKGLGRETDAVLSLDRLFFGHARWVGGISKVILSALIACNRFFSNVWGYGFAIIVVTIVVKILLWPLTHKSMVSMRKMQKIQPLVQELREKHKDDPQTANKKMMELYREHKVNPLGGCLPVLCQIPVFIALFNTLRNAVEIRQAAFLWVADLSQPDTIASPLGFPLRVMPLLMGGSMFMQQKLSPTSADPNQQKMMLFMTVFLMFIFYRMPAGLNLYWTMNQLLTIGQHLASNWLEERKKGE